MSTRESNLGTAVLPQYAISGKTKTQTCNWFFAYMSPRKYIAQNFLIFLKLAVSNEFL
jgi:hypothetical protein